MLLLWSNDKESHGSPGHCMSAVKPLIGQLVIFFASDWLTWRDQWVQSFPLHSSIWYKILWSKLIFICFHQSWSFLHKILIVICEHWTAQIIFQTKFSTFTIKTQQLWCFRIISLSSTALVKFQDPSNPSQNEYSLNSKAWPYPLRV